ncbi:hypothetical protein VIGAN_06056500 [Vigna angularis var. angularis]|uniref:Uncharacterized protein n=1 Tax=Vigna angularis var. angularis TaxID=157739 RepID=A0A0S3S9V9_PHAAN|nr:hypothetical protein VIGAN_06056500 [Vigna angularis var. angularis]
MALLPFTLVDLFNPLTDFVMSNFSISLTNSFLTLGDFSTILADIFIGFFSTFSSSSSFGSRTPYAFSIFSRASFFRYSSSTLCLFIISLASSRSLPIRSISSSFCLSSFSRFSFSTIVASFTEIPSSIVGIGLSMSTASELFAINKISHFSLSSSSIRRFLSLFFSTRQNLAIVRDLPQW